MQMHISQSNKLASIGTMGLLLLAGVAGMVFLLPLQSAHAAGPTVSLSTITSSGGAATQAAATSGTVASSLTLTGTGFLSNKPIEIYSTVGSSTVTWFSTTTTYPTPPSADGFSAGTTSSPSTCGGAFQNAYGGVGSQNSLVALFNSGANSCLITTAVGSFEVTLTVPAMPGGPQTIVVSDGTNSVSTPFTINPKVTFSVCSGSGTCSTSSGGGYNFGFPEEGVYALISVTGFGSAESVSFASTAFTAASLPGACTTGTTLGGTATTGDGSCNTGQVTVVIADTTGGSHTITATGATTGLTATTTYTVNPWVAFYTSASGEVTTYSFLGAAPTSLLIEGHGFAAGTIAAGSITVGGVTTNHQAITVGTSGNFFNEVVSPTSNVPYGPVSVVIQGTTFNYASGNILTTGFTPGTVVTTGAGSWGGALISSIQGTGGGTGVAVIDASSYKPGTPYASPAAAHTTTITSPAPQQNQIGIFGYGFCTGITDQCTPTTTGGALTASLTNTGAAWCSSSACTATGAAPAFQTGNSGGSGSGDKEGAFFAIGFLYPTPWSTSASPSTAASYTITVAQGTAGSTGPGNVLSPSFGITPWIDTSGTGTGTRAIPSTTVDYLTTGETFIANGFGYSDVLTATIGGLDLVGTNAGTCPSSGTTTTGGCTTITGRVPDLSGGKQNVVITGSVSGQSASAVGAVTYDPVVSFGGSPVLTALSSVAGSAGSTTILDTATNSGVHGLLANTGYTVVWNPGSGAPVSEGTFTSTATGGIPVPGVQFTIPSDISGLHIIDIQPTASLGTSDIFGNTHAGDFQLSDSTDVTGLLATYASNYGDLLFNEGATLISTPTVANVGSSIGITGTGLSGSTVYDLSLVSGSSGSCTGVGQSLTGSFTTSASGAVPTGVTVPITDMPTYSQGASVASPEQGSLYCVAASTGTQYQNGVANGYAAFELQASASDNATSEPVGHNVVMSAHGLLATTAYNILFNPQSTSGSSGLIYTGTIVGAILSNSVGAGSATFTVPNVPTGTYTVELQKIGANTNEALAVPPTLTVSSVSTSSCSTTSCMSISGTPSEVTIGANKAVQSSFTNTSNSPVTAIVYAVVHNANGQTVSYSTATITAAAGSSATAYDVLFGLAPGTYSVTIFATSTSGTAISTTSTATVTI